MRKKLRIGTRRSPLALWQAEHVKALMEKEHPDLTCELVRIVTQGDKILDSPLAEVGGKGLFVKEIETALIRSEVDLAVHSMKDLPAELPAELTLAAIPEREDPRDALIFRGNVTSLRELSAGSCIGTSSLRRVSQLRFHRPDITAGTVRGNVDTRIKRLDEGRFDAIVLALAGLKRLGRTDRIHEILSPEVCLPAIGQGALAIETRAADSEIIEMLRPLHDEETAICVRGERALLVELEGSCQIPLAGLGILENNRLILTGLIADVDGSQCFRMSRHGLPVMAEAMGVALARELLAAGGEEILRKIKEGGTP